jgi:flagellar hook-basal body complex protein FliE
MADLSTLELEGLSRRVQIDGDGGQSREMSQQRLENKIAESGIDAAKMQSSGKGFGEMLTDAVESVNQSQVNADRAIKNLLSGRTKNIHETMLAVEKADVSLKMMMQVRNKVVDAYREVMRMQV